MPRVAGLISGKTRDRKENEWKVCLDWLCWPRLPGGFTDQANASAAAKATTSAAPAADDGGAEHRQQTRCGWAARQSGPTVCFSLDIRRTPLPKIDAQRVTDRSRLMVFHPFLISTFDVAFDFQHGSHLCALRIDLRMLRSRSSRRAVFVTQDGSTNGT